MNSSQWAQTQQQKTYDPAYFPDLFSIEDQHFWFRTRNNIIHQLVNKITADFLPGYRVLEIGCGTGNVLKELESACTGGIVIGADLFFEGLKFAQKSNCGNLVQCNANKLPFEENIQLVALFDVLEHLPNDVQILDNIQKILADQGLIFITVPANPALWSYFDEASCHFRRYTYHELKMKLQQTGYEVKYISYYFSSLYPFIWLVRRFSSLWKKARKNDGPIPTKELTMDEFRIIPGINRLLTWWLSLEASLTSRWIALPFGPSLIAIAKKETPK